MTSENQHFDRKSLRKVTGKTADWPALALDCVAFANAQGGNLLIGIEDGQEAPPPGQTLSSGLTETVAKRMRELTVNVELAAARSAQSLIAPSQINCSKKRRISSFSLSAAHMARSAGAMSGWANRVKLLKSSGGISSFNLSSSIHDDDRPRRQAVCW